MGTGKKGDEGLVDANYHYVTRSGQIFRINLRYTEHGEFISIYDRIVHREEYTPRGKNDCSMKYKVLLFRNLGP